MTRNWIHINFQGELGRLLKTTFQERKTKCHFLMEIRYVHRSCQMYLPIGYIFLSIRYIHFVKIKLKKSEIEKSYWSRRYANQLPQKYSV